MITFYKKKKMFQNILFLKINYILIYQMILIYK